MKLTAPDYYPAFRCTADRCKHSCCVGWEIDIDPESLARFQGTDGATGDRLRAAIDPAPTPHFRLTHDERCPFLAPNGLCDLICELGEDALCQICADHPRFRSEFSHCTELGLGLVCEAAAELVLTRTAPMQLITLWDDGGTEEPREDEQYLLQVRSTALQIARDRDFSVAERLEHLQDFFGVTLPDLTPSQWAAVYRDLERLDEHWTELLDALEQPIPPLPEGMDIPFEQLLVYFLYRHLPAALTDGDVESKIGFAVVSTRLLMWLHGVTDTPLTELARLYSGEVEYSDENLDILWDFLWE